MAKRSGKTITPFAQSKLTGATHTNQRTGNPGLTLLQRLLKERLERPIELRGLRADADVGLWTGGLQGDLDQQ